MRDDVFKFRRFYSCFKKELIISRAAILNFTVTLSAFLLISGILFPNPYKIQSFSFLLVLFLGGMFVAGKAFTPLHDKRKGYMFLMLPCSNFEKLFVKLFMTVVCYLVGIVLCFYIVSIVVAGLWRVFVGYNMPLFNIFYRKFLYDIYIYVILQSIFLLGSVYFRNRPIIKTLLSVFCLMLIIGLFMLLSAAIFSVPIMGRGWYLYGTLFVGSDVKLLIGIITIPCCWVLTYLRLKEAEV